ncbi:MAG: PLP-dependent aminotransferase family protein, partial [Acetatifactor muris]|nr:PLP-dependent aminotransferase family protein [Acetatifactor muris]
PSTRALAEYLQVSRSTVDFAYEQLVSEGYIEAVPHRGFFVCRLEELPEAPLQDSFGSMGKDNSLKGARESSAGTACKSTVEAACASVSGAACENAPEWDFSPNGLDMSVFPYSVWKRITRNILTEGNEELFALGEPQGDYDLRQTISRYLHSARAVNCMPEQIVVGAGNDYLLMLLEKILGRHVRIAMENPTYKRSYRIFQSFAYDIVPVDMDEWGMEACRLEQENVKAAYVMPSHQFPTGTVMPIGRRMELLKWADGKEDRYLIEDDYDSEFRYHGKPIPALQASDKHGKVIYMGTFSKAIAPAIRVSFMVLPQTLLEKYDRDCSFYSCTVSRIDQRILDEFIRDGYFERHLNKMRKIYRGKHDILLECLQPLRKEFTLSGENAGLHFLLTSKSGISERELVRTAAEEGVRIYGLSESMMEQTADSATVLLGFGGLREEQLREGIRRLESAWRRIAL